MGHTNLKYRYRKQRLNFTDNLVCNENELSVVDLPAEKMEELLAEGRISKVAGADRCFVARPEQTVRRSSLDNIG